MKQQNLAICDNMCSHFLTPQMCFKEKFAQAKLNWEEFIFSQSLKEKHCLTVTVKFSPIRKRDI